MSVPTLDVVQGYRPGLLGRITEMHALSYERAVGFGRRFEALVAGGLAEFAERLDNPHNAIWAAVQGERIVGSIAIDGEPVGLGAAHLRWFIADEDVRGAGLGTRLLTAALAFADSGPFERAELWTFRGLDAARQLYERVGFACVEERLGDRWGREVCEQRFARRRAAAPRELK